jgi:predicted MPP superfamily phosphohydrolase
MVKLQILSDIHLEYRSSIFKFPKVGDYLALLGDIGDPFTTIYQDFLKAQSMRFEKVYVIAGNHEYYGHSIRQTKTLLKSLCKSANNIMFMDDKIDVLNNGTVLIGTTLWSKLDTRDDWSKFGDFLKIKDWNVRKTLREHNKNVKFIKNSLEHYSDSTCIVLTHHAPSKINTSKPSLKDSKMNSAYATDLEHLFCPQLKIWAHGHTHWSGDQIINNTRIISNQVGKIGEYTRYNRFFVIEV